MEDRFTTKENLPEQDLGGPVGLPRMEIHVNLWREMSTDDLGRTTIQNRGHTISKYHEGCDMECRKKLRDGTYPHVRRIKTSPGRSSQGNCTARQILADVTRWCSGSTSYRKDSRSVLHSGVRTHVRRNGPVSSEGPTKDREPL